MRRIQRANPEIEARWLARIRSIASELLAPYDVDLYLFGSRARGDARPASDIDLAVDPHGELPALVLAELEDRFEESTVPVRVDLIDLRHAGVEFRKRVLEEAVRWIARSA